MSQNLSIEAEPENRPPPTSTSLTSNNNSGESQSQEEVEKNEKIDKLDELKALHAQAHMASSTNDLNAINRNRHQEIVSLMKATGATMQEIIEFREIFELVDADRGGSIDSEELRRLTELLNMDTSEDELNRMLEEIDTTGTGELFFPDFVRCMIKKPNVDYTMGEVLNSFNMLAGNGNDVLPGYIDATRLTEKLMNGGFDHEKLSKGVVEEIIGLSEPDGEGKINYLEFCNLMMGQQKTTGNVDVYAGEKNL